MLLASKMFDHLGKEMLPQIVVQDKELRAAQRVVEAAEQVLGFIVIGTYHPGANELSDALAAYRAVREKGKNR